MKNLVLFLFASILLFTGGGCIKGDENCQQKTIASETASMQAFATRQNMNYITHSSGILYEIMSNGAGINPNSSSKLFVRFTGKLPDGSVFDSQTDHTQTGWVLGSLIGGWQLALPLIQKGGRIRFIVPSSLAYGCAAVGTIPSNTILYFDVELVDIQ